MRNIRTDLQERLDAVVREREELQRRLTDLDPVEAAIKALIKREDETFVAAPMAPLTPFPHSSPVAAAPAAPAEDSYGTFGATEVRSPVKQTQWGELLKPGSSSR